jgi:hypothetical protein
MSTSVYGSWSQLRETNPTLPKSRAGRIAFIQNRGFPAPYYMTANKPVWNIDEVHDWISKQPRSWVESAYPDGAASPKSEG